MGTGIGDLFANVITQSSFVIQIVMLLLAILSVASWSVIFLKFITLTAAKRKAVTDFKAFSRSSSLAEAMKSVGGDSSSSIYRIGNMAVSELRRLEQAHLSTNAKSKLAMDNIRRTLRQGVSIELNGLSGSLGLLSTCANIAPFLGLFGTVWGIMRSFNAIGVMKTASLTVVGPGIAEALTTTVVGLAVAIPAAMGYNFFLSLLSKVETELVNFAGAFLNRMQSELPWTDNNGS